MNKILRQCCGCNKYKDKDTMQKLQSGAWACKDCLDKQARRDNEIVTKIEGIFDYYGIEGRNRAKLLEAYSKYLDMKYGNSFCFTMRID